MREIFVTHYRGEYLVIVYDKDKSIQDRCWIDSGHESQRYANARKDEIEEQQIILIENHNKKARMHTFQPNGFDDGCALCG